MKVIILWTVVLILIAVGMAGTFLPMLPGTPIIFLGVFIYAFFTNFESIGFATLIVLGVIAVLSQILDYLAGIYGAKKMGSTKWGIIGSIIFGIVGAITGNIIGMIVGAFVGAVIFEMIFARKNANDSFKAGIGGSLGFLGGTVAKILFGFLMIGVFVASFLI